MIDREMRRRGVNDVFPPHGAAARFHHPMAPLPPFPNGNGRHARIAADILLEEVYRHPPVARANGLGLQASNERGTACIAALRAAEGGDFDPLIAYVRVSGTEFEGIG